MYKNPERVCRANSADAVPQSATPLFHHRRFGTMVREAELYGVLPDLVTSESAYDDDGEDGVDPYADPTLDRVDMLRLGMIASSTVAQSTPQVVADTTMETTEVQPGTAD